MKRCFSVFYISATKTGRGKEEAQSAAHATGGATEGDAAGGDATGGATGGGARGEEEQEVSSSVFCGNFQKFVLL